MKVGRRSVLTLLVMCVLGLSLAASAAADSTRLSADGTCSVTAKTPVLNTSTWKVSYTAVARCRWVPVSTTVWIVPWVNSDRPDTTPKKTCPQAAKNYTYENGYAVCRFTTYRSYYGSAYYKNEVHVAWTGAVCSPACDGSGPLQALEIKHY